MSRRVLTKIEVQEYVCVFPPDLLRQQLVIQSVPGNALKVPSGSEKTFGEEMMLNENTNLKSLTQPRLSVPHDMII